MTDEIVKVIEILSIFILLIVAIVISLAYKKRKLVFKLALMAAGVPPVII